MTFSVHIKDSFAWLRGLGSESVDLVITDPPYSSLEKHRAKGTTTRLKVSDASSNEWFEVIGNDRLPELLRELYRVLRPDRHCYVFSDTDTLFHLRPAAEAAGFEMRRVIVWDKIHIGMGYGYRSQVEFVMYLRKGKRQVADLGVGNLLRAKRVSNGYPTEKPVALLEVLVGQSAFRGELVIDPFLGSGSTGVAALRKGCRFAGCDISPKSIVTAMPRLAAEAEGRRAESVVGEVGEVGTDEGTDESDDVEFNWFDEEDSPYCQHFTDHAVCEKTCSGCGHLCSLHDAHCSFCGCGGFCQTEAEIHEAADYCSGCHSDCPCPPGVRK